MSDKKRTRQEERFRDYDCGIKNSGGIQTILEGATRSWGIADMVSVPAIELNGGFSITLGGAND